MALKCGVCGKLLFLFKYDIKPGKICENCLLEIDRYRNKMEKPSVLEVLTWEELKQDLAESNMTNEFQKAQQKKILDFGATAALGTVHFNDNTNEMLIEISDIKSDVFRYDQIISFDLIENGNSVISGGTGRAVAGGILFGEVGAIVGGVTATRKMTDICTLLKVKITFRNCERQSIDITLINNDHGYAQNSDEYTTKYQLAEKIMTALQVAVDRVKTEESPAKSSMLSGADEILKYKNLMDAGIITEEEFQAKKKQLLGL